MAAWPFAIDTRVSDGCIADWLDGTRVTDAGMEHLSGMTRLKELGLECVLVSDARIAELKRRLPSARIWSTPHPLKTERSEAQGDEGTPRKPAVQIENPDN